LLGIFVKDLDLKAAAVSSNDFSGFPRHLSCDEYGISAFAFGIVKTDDQANFALCPTLESGQ
jgi:hypothetical protein